MHKRSLNGGVSKATWGPKSDRTATRMGKLGGYRATIGRDSIAGYVFHASYEQKVLLRVFEILL